jgi:hypothetical protein
MYWTSSGRVVVVLLIVDKNLSRLKQQLPNKSKENSRKKHTCQNYALMSLHGGKKKTVVSAPGIHLVFSPAEQS